MIKPKPGPLGRDPLSRREFLLLQALEAGVPLLMVAEAVSTTALAHPEWDMTERRPLREWMETQR